MNATLDIYDQHFAFIHYKSLGDSHLGNIPKTLNNPHNLSLFSFCSSFNFSTIKDNLQKRNNE